MLTHALELPEPVRAQAQNVEVGGASDDPENQFCPQSCQVVFCFLCSVSFSVGSSQAAETHTDTQSLSHQKDTRPKLRGQLEKSSKKNKAFQRMQEMVLKLQQVLMNYFLHLTSLQTQCLLPEGQQDAQGSRKREKRMGYILSQMINLIRLDAIKKLKFKELLPHPDTWCISEAGWQAL